MADYYQLKNQNIFNPPANTSLGNATNQFDDVYVQNDLVLGNVTVTGSTIVSPKVSTITYPGDDTAADPAGGQTITLTGTGFLVGATVLINNIEVSVVSVVSSTTITFTSPANSTGSYILYVINTDGGTAIAIPGIQYSGTPTWTTAAGSLGSVYETGSFNSTVTATGDAPITYSVASGTLPPGATFNSNGTITGTSELLASPTTYTFTVRATDAELQDTNRTFSLTINPDVVTWNSPANGTSYSVSANSAISNVTLDATSAVGSGIAYSANALPDGISLSGNTISGTPTVAANSSSLLTATANTTSESSNITINWVITVSNDVYFEYNTLLIPGASTTFVDDASTNNFAVTINGDTKPNNFNPYTPGYYSTYNADSSDTGFGVDANVALDLTADFTIECWAQTTALPTTNAFQTSAGGYQSIFGTGPANSSSGSQLYIGTTNIYFDISNDGGGPISVAHGMSAGAWYHIAVTRSGTTFRIFINGVLLQTATSSGSWVTGYAWGIQRPEPPGSYIGAWWRGNISNFRVIKGTAIYTAAFTPSTTPLTAISGTQLLVAQSNRFIDTSTNNFTITYGSGTRPQISSFDPFIPNSSYSSYGSGYFDGTGDYLTLTGTALGSGNFTIEMWVNISSLPNAQNGIYSNGTSDNTNSTAAVVYISSGRNLGFYNYPTATATSNTISLNTWQHVAVVRNSGTITLYINGVSGATFSNSNNISDTAIQVMRGFGGITSSPIGYVSDARVVVGTAVYTTTFTPPSAPLTAVANTQLLTLQNNQSVNNNVFLDNSTNNFLVTRAGNTTQGTFSPYGGNWSNYFDGAGDNLGVNYASGSTLAGNFTIESWVYDLNPTGYGTVLGWRNGSSGWTGMLIQRSGSNNLTVAINNNASNIVQSNGTYLGNQWNHVALVRVGTTVTLYVNGTSAGTSTVSGSFNPGSSYRVGTDPFNDVSAVQLKGYISNQRVVNGTAIYTGNFTPPTTPLTPVANTGLLTCQSNRIVDNSTNNFTITKVNDVSVQRFSPFSPSSVTPTSYSGYFDGSGDYLNAPSNAVFGFGTGDFTVEGWFYFTGTISTYQRPWWFGDDNDNIEINGSVLRVGGATQGTLITGGTTILANTWYHIALTRASGSYKLWLNGSQQGSTASNSYNSSARTFTAMATSGGSNPSTGYVSNLRIVKGTAVYTTTFTPSTTPLTAISGTSLLTLQSTTFIDNSTNNLTLTAVGNTTPTIQNPFGYTSTTTNGYSVSTIGGSGYFDGSGDYLSIADNPAFQITGDFTFEAWVYQTSSKAVTVLGQWPNSATTSFIFRIESNGKLSFAYNVGGEANGTASTSAITYNTWNHVVWTRSGTTVKYFINGVQDATTVSVSGSFADSAGAVLVGLYNTSVDTYFNGYISDARFIKGTSLYTSSFVPPAQPLTAVQNTVLLTNMTSAGIYDASMMNDMESVGDAKLSTAVSKFGGSSMYFDGTGDYLSFPSNTVYAIGATEDYTVECWVNFSTVQTCAFWQTTNNTSSANGPFWFGYEAGALKASRHGSGSYAVSYTWSPSTSTWYHVAATRASGTVKLFVNGAVVATSSAQNGIDFTQSGGAVGMLTTPAYLVGYLDDLRFTKGYARYTSNFTPPASAFPLY